MICDGRGTLLHVITTAANVNDITQTLNLVDGTPPVPGRPGRPRRRPESLLGDKGGVGCLLLHPPETPLHEWSTPCPMVSNGSKTSGSAWATTATCTSPVPGVSARKNSPSA
ncbi:hypothetical protein IHE61_26135 [Streptomyces sp. GKU 257-1]|nr:hypothetical protein [Streptomyces sp. GKU 257-1]